MYSNCFNCLVIFNTWSPHRLDTIIFESDTLYSIIVNDRFQGDASRYLSQNELPSQFNAFGETYRQSLVETSVLQTAANRFL